MLKEKPAPRKPNTKTEIIFALIGFALLTLFAFWLVRFLMTASWRSIISYGIFMVFIISLGLLSSRFKRFGNFIDKVFAAYFRFTWWMFLSFVPIIIFYYLSPIILNSLPLWAQIVVFAFWFVLLVAGAWAVLTENNRERFLVWLQLKIARFAPVAYALNLLIIAILFFSSVTYVLVDHGRLSLNIPTAQKISPGALRDFYSWHFLNAIPLLKVTETLRLKEPIAYEGSSVGSLLLLFKLIVIVPVIAAWTWYWKKVGKPAEKT